MSNCPPLTRKSVKKALSESTDWDFSNNVLYKLCADNPNHDDSGVIMAKTMLIGRAYSAAIERGRKPRGRFGDNFYKDKVARLIKNSHIDDWFSALRRSPVNAVANNLEIHKKLMNRFHEISGKDNRSLASKYLHFHFPMRFYIFDSNAQRAISRLTQGNSRNLQEYRECDDTYARFYLRCAELNEGLVKVLGRRLSPRDLDKVLFAWEKKYGLHRASSAEIS